MASEPVRTCVGCRERTAKRELLRVTVGSDAHGQPVVVPDPSATAPGRGAHLHPTTECYELAARRKAFGRALRVRPGTSAVPVGAYLDQIQVTQIQVAQSPAAQDRSLTKTHPPDESWSSSS